jgi:hypothetical protein
LTPICIDQTEYKSEGLRRDDQSDHESEGSHRDDQTKYESEGSHRDDQTDHELEGSRRGDQTDHESEGSCRDGLKYSFGDKIDFLKYKFVVSCEWLTPAWSTGWAKVVVHTP